MKPKLFLLFPLLSLAACSSDINYDTNPIDPNIHYDNVYLIMGQSNASGISPVSFLETKAPETYAKYLNGYEKVYYSSDCDNTVTTTFEPVRLGKGNSAPYFGPEIGIADAISSNEETSYIIKATLSGSTLQTQYINKNGQKFNLYNRFVPFINQQLRDLKESGKNPRVRGIFWMQGESDSTNQALSSTYQAATSVFIQHLRHDINEYVFGYVNFVDAYISTKSHHWVYSNEINQAKLNVSNENEHNYCIKTNGEDEGALDLVLKSAEEDPNDDAHYDSLSMLALGREAGKYLIK